MDNELSLQLQKVLELFCIKHKYLGYEQVCNGNVNKTYIVSCDKNGAVKKYVVQRINTYAFKDPDVLMKNIDLVTEYVREKYPNRLNLHFHHTAERKIYIINGDGVWRLFNYIPSVTFNSCDNLEILKSAGMAFGEFQNLLGDFDASRLAETIPDFHNTRKRLDDLFEAVKKDDYNRVSEAKEEIEYIRSVRDTACKLVDMRERGEIPLRVTHNDTKINNVLFDEKTFKPLCVIDLDTVMPGLLSYDYADAVRFVCNTEEEDGERYSDVKLDFDKFKAFTEGFLSQTKESMTDNERNSLAESCFCITVELASRFLTDYLSGDRYFKTTKEKHNLVRTKNQLALAKYIAAHLDELKEIIRNI